ncbi:MAG TPA: hypothetical protein PLD59_09455, partial [Tepidisphaeraceae bacterium]|nr:hypothetical protein [Tepidisphaeraceae bacterium]
MDQNHQFTGFRWTLLGAAIAGVLSFSAEAYAEDRTINGSGNNLQQPNRGAANTAFIRLGYPEVTCSPKPDPRVMRVLQPC